jgi:hypothetical protein
MLQEYLAAAHKIKHTMILTAVNKLSQRLMNSMTGLLSFHTLAPQQLATSKTQSSSISKESNECINKGYACDVQLPAVK